MTTDVLERNDSALATFLKAIESSTDTATRRSLVLKLIGHAHVFAGFSQVSVNDTVVQATLELFARGTYGDYISDKSRFLPLSNAQKLKLQQLTVMSLLEEGVTTHLSYSTLQKDLHCDDWRSVEDILQSGSYAGLFTGKYCQQTQQWLNPVACMVRDATENPREVRDRLVPLCDRLNEAHKRLGTTQTALIDLIQSPPPVSDAHLPLKSMLSAGFAGLAAPMQDYIHTFETRGSQKRPHGSEIGGSTIPMEGFEASVD